MPVKCLKLQYEPVSKRFSLFKVKEGENFSHRNTWSISRIALKVSADASLRVTKVPKFEHDAEIGQNGTF